MGGDNAAENEDLSPEQEAELEEQAMEAEFDDKEIDEEAVTKELQGAEGSESEGSEGDAGDDDDEGQQGAESEKSEEGDTQDDDEGDDDSSGSEDDDGEDDDDEEESELDQKFSSFREELMGSVKTELNKIAGTVNGLQGYVKNLSKKAEDATDDAGGDSPSQSEVSEALKDADSYAKLKEQYPEWGEAMDAQMGVMKDHIIGQLDKKQPAIDMAAIEKSVSQIVDGAISRYDINRTISAKHKNWQQTVKSEPFKKWRSEQPPEIQALASSSDPADAIEMIDKFEESRKASRRRRKQEQRLEDSVDPTSGGASGGSSEPQLSEEDYMEQEFQS
jgi:hypothetical protein